MGTSPILLSLVEWRARYVITKKLKDGKANIVYVVLKDIIKSNKEIFIPITLDNGSKIARVSELEGDRLDIYFAHAYAAWERGINENFNKLLRDFIPKGETIKDYSQEYISKAGKQMNNRIREVIGFKGAAKELQRELDKKIALP